MSRLRGSFDVEELERHEHEGIVFVHCPDCKRPLGSWNSRSDRPTRPS
ncbi:hypothetical protein ACFQH6_05280 [Halobacteriaceae archaeon GCM10025711]